MNFSKVLDRLKEPSSSAGIIGLVLGAGQLFKINEAEAVAGVVGDVAAGLEAGPIAGLLALIAGIFAIVRGEKGKK